MRIVGGRFAGRDLTSPNDFRVRPTAEHVRAAILDLVAADVDGARVLDLFAGTGALGLEALSRGAPQAVFVERDPAALSALRRNLREVKMEDRAEVLGADVRVALRRLAAQSDKFGPFSWVFLDPPYVRETEGLLGELCGLDVLSNCAVVVVEHDRRHRPAERVGCLFLTDRRQYGDTELSFYRSSGS